MMAVPTPSLQGPQLGWVALSRKALAAAEKLVRDDNPGVRDEVGVLALHRGYADRFFPAQRLGRALRS